MATQTSLPGHQGGVSQTWPSAKGTQRPERPDPWGNTNTAGVQTQIRDGRAARRPDISAQDDRGSN